ncbi:hypothetical protein PGKDCPLP_01172 [Stenotrophomonas maltophilia]|nr:hypothetical protein PGKDCPLP_01172 [Stenotrophomonas maltophilia]
MYSPGRSPAIWPPKISVAWVLTPSWPCSLWLLSTWLSTSSWPTYSAASNRWAMSRRLGVRRSPASRPRRDTSSWVVARLPAAIST